ncbi:MAG: hypothetical protein AB7N80_00735 [Bdellovibrionales bacterium]
MWYPQRVLLVLISIICLCHEQVGAEDCSKWLNSDNLPTREKMPFQLAQTLIRRRAIREDGVRPAQNIFEKINFAPQNGDPIVFVGWGKYIGDSIIGTVSMLDALHRMFPDSHIYHASPGGNLIQPQSWLTILPFSASAEKIYSASGPHAFWFTQKGTHLEFVRKAGLKGLITDEINLPHGLLVLNVFDRGEQQDVDIYLDHRDPQTSGMDYAIYRKEDFLIRLFFGNENGFFIPPQFFLRPGHQTHISRHMNSSFPGRAQNKFAVLNLNTAGQFKIDVMAKHYVANLKLLVRAIKKKDPSLNILVTPPEAAFGADVVEAVKDFVQSNKSTVAFMPDNKLHWQAFVAASQFVITQDSGFMHLALVMKDPSRVFGFGHESGLSDVMSWAMPGQTCGVLLGRMIPELKDWILSR